MPRRLRAWSRRAAAGWALAVAAHAAIVNTDREVLQAETNGVWVWEGRYVGRAMKRALGPLDPYLAVDAAGSLPYASELRALDMLGLTDAWLPRHPPPGWGRGGLGHDLGDGGYVWRRAPDIIALNSALGSHEPKWVGGRQLFARRDFLEVYQPLRFAGSRPDGSEVAGYYFFRRADGPLGIRASPDRVEIPAWFLARPGSDPARVGKRGRVFATVVADRPAVVPELLLPEGTWRVLVPEGVQLEVTCRGRSATRRRRAETPVLRAFDRVAMDLALWIRPGSEPVQVSDLVLERADDPASLGCGPNLIVVPDALPGRVEPGTPIRAPGLVVFDEKGVEVELAGPTHHVGLELGVDGRRAHTLEWSLGGDTVHTVAVGAVGANGVRPLVVSVPPDIAARGYDAVRVLPVGGPGVLAYVVPHPGGTLRRPPDPP